MFSHYIKPCSLDSNNILRLNGHASMRPMFQIRKLDSADTGEAFVSIFKHLVGWAFPCGSWGGEGGAYEIVNLPCCQTCELECRHHRIYLFWVLKETVYLDVGWIETLYLDVVNEINFKLNWLEYAIINKDLLWNMTIACPNQHVYERVS